MRERKDGALRKKRTVPRHPVSTKNREKCGGDCLGKSECPEREGKKGKGSS